MSLKVLIKVIIHFKDFMFASEQELNSFANLEFYASYHTLEPGTPFLVVNNCTGTLSVGQQSWQIAGINCNWVKT